MDDAVAYCQAQRDVRQRQHVAVSARGMWRYQGYRGVCRNMCKHRYGYLPDMGTAVRISTSRRLRRASSAGSKVRGLERYLRRPRPICNQRFELVHHLSVSANGKPRLSIVTPFTKVPAVRAFCMYGALLLRLLKKASRVGQGSTAMPRS